MADDQRIPSPTSGAASPRRTSSLAVALAWLVVILPAAWGITQTIRTSLRLFAAPVAPAAPSAPSTRPASALLVDQGSHDRLPGLE